MLVVLLLAGILSACGDGPSGVKGKVTNTRGEALPQLTVQAKMLSPSGQLGEGSIYQSSGAIVEEQTTDAEGRFNLTLQPGRYIIRIDQDGTEVGNRLVEVKLNRTTTVQFLVPPATP